MATQGSQLRVQWLACLWNGQAYYEDPIIKAMHYFVANAVDYFSFSCLDTFYHVIA